VTGLAVGAILGFHGGTLGAAAETRSLAAPLWGILAGLVVGASLGPVFAAVASVAVGYFLDSSAYFALAALFGLFAGPLLGVVAWEAGYWLADFLRATRSSHE
jgi:hypothetical protein